MTTKRGKTPPPVPPHKGAGSPSKKQAHEAVKALAKLFAEAPPGGAPSGVFSPSKADGISSPAYPYPVPDGAYRVKGSPWTFSFQGGRLIQAVHEHVKHLIAGEVTAIG